MLDFLADLLDERRASFNASLAGEDSVVDRLDCAAVLAGVQNRQGGLRRDREGGEKGENEDRQD
ncbi:MAG: hypothetical protein AABZ51_05595 [Nitrospirota bacterium]